MHPLVGDAVVRNSAKPEARWRSRSLRGTYPPPAAAAGERRHGCATICVGGIRRRRFTASARQSKPPLPAAEPTRSRERRERRLAAAARHNVSRSRASVCARSRVAVPRARRALRRRSAGVSAEFPAMAAISGGSASGGCRATTHARARGRAHAALQVLPARRRGALRSGLRRLAVLALVRVVRVRVDVVVAELDELLAEPVRHVHGTLRRQRRGGGRRGAAGGAAISPFAPASSAQLRLGGSDATAAAPQRASSRAGAALGHGLHADPREQGGARRRPVVVVVRPSSIQTAAAATQEDAAVAPSACRAAAASSRVRRARRRRARRAARFATDVMCERFVNAAAFKKLDIVGAGRPSTRRTARAVPQHRRGARGGARRHDGHRRRGAGGHAHRRARRRRARRPVQRGRPSCSPRTTSPTDERREARGSRAAPGFAALVHRLRRAMGILAMSRAIGDASSNPTSPPADATRCRSSRPTSLSSSTRRRRLRRPQQRAGRADRAVVGEPARRRPTSSPRAIVRRGLARQCHRCARAEHALLRHAPPPGRLTRAPARSRRRCAARVQADQDGGVAPEVESPATRRAANARRSRRSYPRAAALVLDS